MNSRPADALDRDALVEQLSRLDSDDPGDAAIAPTSGTVSGLKAELDTLVAQLREPAGPAPYADETGLRRAHELVLAIGVEPESKPHIERPELGRIGPYELLEKLGEGGMGAVYKALHSSLERIVALKILPQSRLDPPAVSRFKREMKAVGKLDHPNIVRATDAGEVDGNHFLVMEYVEGVDLSELLRRVGPLSAADACELVRQAAVGLQHAHQRGMVHRDIKPSNLMLAWSDEQAPVVKVLDLGLALLSEPVGPTHGELTVSGSIMGTLEYMSPEQSQDTHSVDIRADIYSLGATLYKLLCGKAPHSAERFNTPGKLLVALATETPPSISKMRDGLPPGLVAIVDRMLARSPSERFATPAEVVEALTPFALRADLVGLAHSARHHGTPSDKSTDPLIAPTVKLATPVPNMTKASPPSRGSGERSDRSLTTSATEDLTSQPAAQRRRTTVVAVIGLCALIGGVVLFGGQLSRIITNQGQIVIETDGAGIELVIKDQTGKVLVDGETKREITFKAGEYNIEVTVKDSAGEQRFVTDHFTLTRNGIKIVDARWQVAKAVAGSRTRESSDRSLTTSATDAAASTDPDRRAAEWVLSIGGTITIRENGRERQPKATDDLPSGAFELTAARLDARSGSNQKVTNAELAHFQGCQNLTTLDLQRNKLSDAGLAHFKDCKKLENLSLLGLRLVTDEGLANFADCENLTSLNLDSTQLTDTGLSGFRNLKNLTNLNLTGTRVTDAGLSHLKECRQLTTLNLGQTSITDSGLANFQDCHNLHVLVLSRTQVSDAGLANFKTLKFLFRVELGSTQVSDAGLVHLKQCNNMTFLDLSNVRMSDASLDDLARMSRLQHLNLGGTRMSLPGRDRLRSTFPSLKFDWSEPNRNVAASVLALGGSVEISTRDEKDSHPIKAAAELPRDLFQVRRVSLAGVAEPLGKLFAELGRLRFPEFDRLESLDLSGTTGWNIPQTNMDFLAGIHGLQELNFTNAGLTDNSVAKLPNLPTLKRLILNDNNLRGDKGFSRLSGFTQLESLELRRNKIDAIHIGELKQALPNCQIAHDPAEK